MATGSEIHEVWPQIRSGYPVELDQREQVGRLQNHLIPLELAESLRGDTRGVTERFQREPLSAPKATETLARRHLKSVGVTPEQPAHAPIIAVIEAAV